MKEQLSKERLNQLHEALDRELQSMDHFQMIAPQPVTLAAPHPVKSYVKPPHNNELEELQKKLIHLERKMEKINFEENSDFSNNSIGDKEERAIEEEKYKQSKSNQASGKKPKVIPIVTSDQNIRDVLPRGGITKSTKDVTLSSKKKPQSYDLDDSPLKRKYNLNSGLKESPKAEKRKNTNKSLSRELKDQRLNFSRKSISQMSQHSSRSMNKNLTTAQQFSRMERLQQQLAKQKQENKKLKIRVKGLEAIETKYEKLKENFQKSEVIRKQQKVLIQNYKTKKERD